MVAAYKRGQVCSYGAGKSIRSIFYDTKYRCHNPGFTVTF